MGKLKETGGHLQHSSRVMFGTTPITPYTNDFESPYPYSTPICTPMTQVSGELKSIRKLRRILLQSQLFLVYQALVENRLRYQNFIWGHLPGRKLCALQKIQNRAFYLIESAPIRDRIPSARLNLEQLLLYMTGP